ncbi:hypothetical protein AOR_1_1676174 [Paecilomyces variotii No. 5]|uniref:5-oxoprolinase n=1 Tax=Byssochlamys spectabilis (strain No. 5 / NBRC 109023) TaxID=1356009 RepID=V5HX73_BYSSN|nr:hypothetical protein AOR_1_1676174 [Paecilomyces variotii No. 5]
MAGIQTGIKIAIGKYYAPIPGREDVVFKLLSVDPHNYSDAPREAVRRVLEIAEGRRIAQEEKLNAFSIDECRIGTTVATNALLEHKGKQFALLTTKGFKDLCEISDQSRPHLFDLNIRKPKVLFDKVEEIEERVTIENYELDPYPRPEFDAKDSNLVKTESGEIVRIIQPLNVDSTRACLQSLRWEGFDSVAICFIHSHVFPEHERLAAKIAKEEGFESVTISSETSPRIKMLQRATAVCIDAYLSPVVRSYVNGFLDGFDVPPQRVDFMASDGGLRKAEKYTGNAALLSGPAGGVIGVARSCYDQKDGKALIGFDMGGTSTDVSRYDGKLDHIIESTIAGRKVSTPMLNIATVAAGGGSMLFLRNGLLVVGPESAGAHPGPACYRKGGPLTVTDANLFLGRLVVSSFPSIFGETADKPLDTEVVERKFKELAERINTESDIKLSPEQVALGFIDVANESMCRPIRNSTEARGYATYDHNLVSFGGAGGQHACAIASNLGIQRILIHRYSSLLSAYGISLAEITSEVTEPSSLTLSAEAITTLQEREMHLKAKVEQELHAQGIGKHAIEFHTFLNMQYKGMDTILSIEQPADGDYKSAFTESHLREFAFKVDRDIIVDSITLRGTSKTSAHEDTASLQADIQAAKQLKIKPDSVSTQKVYLHDKWEDVPIYKLESMKLASYLTGPAIITDETQTILVENEYEYPDKVNPIQLSCFANRFMSIAEQMGNTLQRTSISTSIKERLDFSCAIFSPDGSLVANAPHIPVHLGSMQFAIQYQHQLWGDKLKPGDVLLTNHPDAGGTHLPDLTVVTPAFYRDHLAFYVASRGHHTDIGGIGITSMIPDSKELWQEGMAVKSMKIVSGGTFLEDEIRDLFNEVSEYPGCSATRRLDDNISDIKAKISANQRGINLIHQLCEEFTLPIVHLYMHGIQDNAEAAIKELFKNVHRKMKGKPLRAVDWLDDGTPIQLEVTIDSDEGTATFDFEGTGAQTYGNMNMPISITHSAIIYVLRTMVDMDIPLNQGCLNPCRILVPEGTVLNPSPTVAICGSTIASQRITDVILKAFGAAAASQGCANSLGWGMGGKDPLTGKVTPGWNYGETVGGGSGAGPTWHGANGVNVHSTNTRATDPEVIEKRTPVIIRRDEINKGTGGRGRFNGGDGVTREVEARIPLKVSILSERRVYSPYGMEGGKPGNVGKNFIFKKNRQGKLEKINIGAKAVVQLQAGDYIQINSPGGGGWGSPIEDTNGHSLDTRPTPY